jgi:anti-anti-sigma regulatory factor
MDRRGMVPNASQSNGPLNPQSSGQALDALAPPETWSDAMAAADAISAMLAHPVDVECRGVAVIVKATGPALGQRDCPAIMEAAAKAFQSAHGRKCAILDLSDIRTFSAMGVGLCTDFAKRARERKLEPILFGLRGDLMDQLRMFKIERLFKVVRARADLGRLIQG